jgi:hypothetical protein
VIHFCVKVQELSIWSEKLLAKAKLCGIKDLLLGKSSIPKVDEEIDETLYTLERRSLCSFNQ